MFRLRAKVKGQEDVIEVWILRATLSLSWQVDIPKVATVQQVKRLLQSKKNLGVPARKQQLTLETKVLLQNVH